MTHDQIATVVKEVAAGPRVMSVMQRTLNKSKPDHYYGAFAPTDEDEHFALNSARADSRIGWRRDYKEFKTQQGVREVGWRVIFEVFDIGPSRQVVANVHGTSERNEVKRFVRRVFVRLAYE